MNITIIGIGGVGGYFGGMIAHNGERRSLDHKVNFIARGDHLTQIKTNGLLLNTSEKKDILCRPALASDNFSELPPSDIIIIAVKSYDLDEVSNKIPLLLKPGSIILPLLNGVDIYERLREKLPDVTILPSCVYVAAYIERPGIITCQEKAGQIITGKDPQQKDYNPGPLIQLLKDTGINFRWEEDPYPAIWEKYTFVASLALTTAYFNETIGGIMSNPEYKNITEAVMYEIVALAAKKSIQLPVDLVKKLSDRAGGLPYEIKTSYQRDVESKKYKNEGELFGGTIIKLGKKLNVPTPRTKELYAKLQYS